MNWNDGPCPRPRARRSARSRARAAGAGGGARRSGAARREPRAGSRPRAACAAAEPRASRRCPRASAGKSKSGSIPSTYSARQPNGSRSTKPYTSAPIPKPIGRHAAEHADAPAAVRGGKLLGDHDEGDDRGRHDERAGQDLDDHELRGGLAGAVSASPRSFRSRRRAGRAVVRCDLRAGAGRTRAARRAA